MISISQEKPLDNSIRSLPPRLENNETLIKVAKYAIPLIVGIAAAFLAVGFTIAFPMAYAGLGLMGLSMLIGAIALKMRSELNTYNQLKDGALTRAQTREEYERGLENEVSGNFSYKHPPRRTFYKYISDPKAQAIQGQEKDDLYKRCQVDLERGSTFLYQHRPVYMAKNEYLETLTQEIADVLGVQSLSDKHISFLKKNCDPKAFNREIIIEFLDLENILYGDNELMKEIVDLVSGNIDPEDVKKSIDVILKKAEGKLNQRQLEAIKDRFNNCPGILLVRKTELECLAKFLEFEYQKKILSLCSQATVSEISHRLHEHYANFTLNYQVCTLNNNLAHTRFDFFEENGVWYLDVVLTSELTEIDFEEHSGKKNVGFIRSLMRISLEDIEHDTGTTVSWSAPQKEVPDLGWT